MDNNTQPKKEITIKKNSKAEVLKRAPDEVIAKAIHEAILKEHEKLGFRQQIREDD